MEILHYIISIIKKESPAWIACCKSLLEHGSDPEIKNNDGLTPKALLQKLITETCHISYDDCLILKINDKILNLLEEYENFPIKEPDNN